jgi:hypothetical protein
MDVDRILDPTDLHIEYVAYDLGSLFYLPTSGVLAESKDGGERDRWVDLLGSGISVLQAVQCLNSGTPRIPLHPAAVIDFEIVRIRFLRVCGGSKAKAKKNASEVASAHGGDYGRSGRLECAATAQNESAPDSVKSRDASLDQPPESCSQSS